MTLIKKILLPLIVSTIVSIAGFFILQSQIKSQQPESSTFGVAAFTPVQASQFTLAGAGVTSSASTVQLTSFKLPDPNRTPITMSMFGDVGYGVLEPQTNKIENISFTGVTQNANGSATLTGVQRGLSFYSPYNASTTLALSHAGGSYMILTNSGAFYGKEFLFANNNGTSTAFVKVASTSPWRYDSVAAQAAGTYIATTSEFASITYVNKIATGLGSPVATESVTGISRLATAFQQGSSTDSGSTVPLVLQAKYATDTPLSSCASGYTAAGAGCSVIAQLTGKIRQTFLNLAEAWAFTGNVTIPANATNPLTLNTIATKWPANSGVASSTVLMNDASGNLSWNNEGVRTIAAFTLTTGTTQTASTSLKTVVIPAGVFAPNKIMRITAQLQATNIPGAATDVCDFNIDYGTGSATTTVAFGQAGAAGSSGFYGTGQITTMLIATSTTQQSFSSNAFQAMSKTSNVNQLVSTYASPVTIAGSSNYQGGGFAAVNTANQSYLSFIAKAEQADTCYIPGGTVELISQ